MSEQEFYKLVSDMRRAQKDYFHTRDKNFMYQAMELEIQVDMQLTAHYQAQADTMSVFDRHN